MKTNQEIKDVIDRVTFEGLQFEFDTEPYLLKRDWIHRPFLRVVGITRCSRTGEEGFASKGRWWRLSRWMTDQEIVGTAFAAVKAYFEHEISEAFKFDGVSVYDFHTDVHALVKLRQSGQGLDERSDGR